jgi:rubrerythrin
VGGRSRAAAQLLAGKGFKDIYNLKGGIKAWEGLTAVGPMEMGMDLLRGDETPEEIIILAYGMEEGLRQFYSAIAEDTEDSAVVKILTELAEVEEKHKQKLLALYITLNHASTDKETFETQIVSKVMEGGFTSEEFLEKNRPAMQTVPDILNVAMMLETQALDLYSRYSQKIKEGQGKKIFYEIADEEKAHLAALGQLMDTRV